MISAFDRLSERASKRMLSVLTLGVEEGHLEVSLMGDLKALANEDTLLPTQMFPRLPVQFMQFMKEKDGERNKSKAL